MEQRRRERGYYRIVCGAGIALLLTGFVFFARPEPLRAATTVSMQNIAFVPATITITVGTTVTWTNNDTVAHTTTSDAGTWDSSILDKGKSFSFTFTKAGTFAYHCDVHPNMHGTITVNAVAAPTATLRPTNTVPPPTPTTPNTATPTVVVSTATTAPTTVSNPLIPPISTPVRPTATSIRTATPLTFAGSTATATVPATTAVPGIATPTVPITSDASASMPPPGVNLSPGAPQPGPVSALPFANFLEPIPAFPDTPDHRYFTATGHSLNFGFKAYWERNGDLAQFGYPISEEFIERGADGLVHTVQYFERARFEYHLDLTTIPFQVELGMLGREMASGRENQTAFAPVSGDAAGAGRQFFAATGHTLGGQFGAYWQANGGMAHFGLPISEEFQETGTDGVSYTVQYFERYRLEYHPDTSSVELGRLGVQDAQSRGYLPET